MIFRSILALLLSVGPQGGGGDWLTLSVADAEVSKEAVDHVRRLAVDALESLRRPFPGLPQRTVRIVLHRRAADLPPALRIMHHEGSPGFALLPRHEVHILLEEARSTAGGLRPVLVHELTHELLQQSNEKWGHLVPRWVHEGIAQVLAGDTYLGASEDAIVWRVAAQQLLYFSELDHRFPGDAASLRLAYAQSHSYVAWLVRRFGMETILESVRRVDEESSFESALARAVGMDAATMQAGWRDFVLNRSGAQWRYLLQQFFSILMILSLPLLALALIKRLRSEQKIAEKLQRADAGEDSVRPPLRRSADHLEPL